MIEWLFHLAGLDWDVLAFWGALFATVVAGIRYHFLTWLEGRDRLNIPGEKEYDDRKN